MQNAPLQKQGPSKWVANRELLTFKEQAEVLKNAFLREVLKNKVRFRLSNDEILKAFADQPLVDPDRVLYFNVTAFDGQYDEGKDHESAFSKEIVYNGNTIKLSKN